MPYLLSVARRFASPWPMSVFVALTEKGVPFSVDPLNLTLMRQRLGRLTPRA
jgi:hypothetical protein